MRTVLLVVALLGWVLPVWGQVPEIGAPEVTLRGMPFDVTVRRDGGLDSTEAAQYQLRAGEATFTPRYDPEQQQLIVEDVVLPAGEESTLTVEQAGEPVATRSLHVLPGWVSVLPPLLAILTALIFRQVVPALFLGVWVGAWAVVGFSAYGLWKGLLDTFQIYVLEALVDSGHAAILLFSMMIGGMVGIISKNGGTQGVVNRLIGWASTARRGQIATGVLGLTVFFDDYANTLVVGNTMRPITDRLRISREKLAYIVDSTAAPVASLALVTTWIGFEVGLIDEALVGIQELDMSGYTVFLESILYRFYPWLALFFVFLIASTDREFGPMYAAERRARQTGAVLAPDAQVDEAAGEGDELAPKAGKPHRALNAVLPVLVLLVGVMAGLYVTGEGATFQEVIGSADAYKALMWASLLSVLAAAALSSGQRILSVEETVDAWYSGVKAMLFAMIILVLAWALSALTEILHTAEYLSAILSQALPPGLVPAIIFLLSAAVAFATGSSWGTMGILMPIVVQLTWNVLQVNDMTDPAHYHILYSAVSCVLAGSVWGDHCSPISDTTILSSMASGCDHIDHVRTQLPYALVVGAAAILLGTIPAGFGAPWWLCMAAAAAVLGASLLYYGRPLADASDVGEGMTRGE